MQKTQIQYIFIYLCLLFVLLSNNLIGQSYSLSPSKIYVFNIDTNSTDFGGIEILNTGAQNLNLNWKLQIVDTLIDSRFELCNSGICSLNLPFSGIMPSITPGNIGWIKFHMYSGVATGTNTISYLIKNGSTAIDTLTFKIIVGSAATGLKETTNIKKVSMFPNPTINEAQINFTLSYSGKVVIKILNNMGQLVDQTLDEFNAGANKINIDTKKLTSGMYDVLIEYENVTITKKLSVLK